MSPRSYDLGRRKALGEATRGRILDAARAILGGKGDPSELSMEAVARRAGVARMTVYNRFRSEGDLLEALADRLASEGGLERLREAFLEPDPAKGIRRFVAIFVGFWASDRLLLRRLRAFGVLHPALYRGLRERDERRRTAARSLLERAGGGAELDARVDLLASLTSFETFDALATEARPVAEVARLLGDAAVGLSRPPDGEARPAPARRTARRSG